MRNVILRGVLGAVAAIGIGVGGAWAQPKPVDVTFGLDFVVLGRHAPWYVALAKGYYRDAGLNVKIVPGQGTAQAIQAVEADITQFAFSDVPSLLIARGRGASSAKLLAVNYQKAPYAIFSLDPGANVTTPEGLKGLEIASGAGSFSAKVIQGFAKEKGIDPASIKFVNVDGAARVSMLLGAKVPAIETFIFGEPGIARRTGDAKLRTLLLADHGLDLYANGLVARQATIRAKPDMVRAFVGASLKGWQDALANPEEAAKLQAGLVPGLEPSVIVDELKILKTLAVTPYTQANGLGAIDPAQMRKAADFVVNTIGIEGKIPDVTELYTTEFLPQPAVKP